MSRPYGSPTERAADRENLLAYWPAIEALIALAELPPARWSDTQAELVDGFLPGRGARLTRDAQAARLGRWATLYRDEIGLIRDVRYRALHEDVTDPELLGATWLARQVLATVAGVQPGEVNQRWARSIAGQASLN
jgi:hypothetical protein